ncbi:Phosphatidylinositol 3,4,5-trisphosphate 3-phosphatase and dual-specificity protein phosphatase PTEN isoform 1 [Schistosoma japonicum]|nr:Phosphatidylinositol 3,4,5-trisphosphate 3-phosphatase and dual-specificity protein phosphatase PTEN isoform 1 [Schistosoma japonicum]TNN14229.1 Phosphatidylinositol 3,4,5-trisphosphate 3-phosphatase and dual-specificity protein phosphatase PTEN isoform 1 [Schistosoma japonicum]
MVCSCLLRLHDVMNAEESLKFYGEQRTDNGKGVTIPSQRRYVHYYDMFLKNNLMYHRTPLFLTAVRICGLQCLPGLLLYVQLCMFNPSNVFEQNCATFFSEPIHQDEALIKTEQNILLFGDVRVKFYVRHHMLHKKICQLWFNTYFVVHGEGPSNCVSNAKECFNNNHCACVFPPPSSSEASPSLEPLIGHSLLKLPLSELDKAYKGKSKFLTSKCNVTLYFTCPYCMERKKSQLGFSKSSQSNVKTTLDLPTNDQKAISSTKRTLVHWATSLSHPYLLSPSFMKSRDLEKETDLHCEVSRRLLPTINVNDVSDCQNIAATHDKSNCLFPLGSLPSSPVANNHDRDVSSDDEYDDDDYDSEEHDSDCDIHMKDESIFPVTTTLSRNANSSPSLLVHKRNLSLRSKTEKPDVSNTLNHSIIDETKLPSKVELPKPTANVIHYFVKRPQLRRQSSETSLNHPTS